MADDHCPAVFQNLAKEQAIWRRMTRVLSREGARLWVSGIFLQSGRLFGAALWCGDVGGYPPHGTVPCGFTGPGGTTTDGTAPAAAGRWELGVHLGGGVKG